MGVSSAEALLGIGAMSIAANYGLLAVAAAFAVRYFLLAPFRLALIKKLAEVKLWMLLKTLLPAIGAGSVMAIAVLVWQNWLAGELSTTALLVSAIVVGVFVFSTAVVIVIPTQMRALLAFARSLRASASDATTKDTS